MPSIQLKTPIPGPRSQELMRQRQAQVARGPFHATPIVIAKGKGALLEDVDGNQLIDFAAGIGVANTGHCNDAVVEAIQRQSRQLLHGSVNVTPYEGYIELCTRLNKAAPISGAKKSFLVNSGAEAVENAIKMARAHTKRQAIVCFDHAFHGRTYMAMTLTSKVKPYKVGFGPYNPEVFRAPFPYAYRWPTTSDPQKVADECFKQFEDLVTSRIGIDHTAAVILEPVLGEGGFVTAPPAFLAKLQAFCKANGIVLIADEIQSGFGRTGTLFASEQLGFEPDLITIAKGLGGGMPISAVTGRAEIMDAPIEGGIGGTYSGNPVSCAAALAVFDLFEKGDILKRSQALGQKIEKRLAAWAEKYPVIGEVRGLGPMRAIEFVSDRKTKTPHPDAAKKLAKYCYEHGLVIMTAGTYGNVVRLLMPLVIEDAQLEEGFAIMEAGLQKLA